MKGRRVPPKLGVDPYVGYPSNHFHYQVVPIDAQADYTPSPGPARPHLLLEVAPLAEGYEANVIEIPYDQLEEVIAVLMQARRLEPPPATWRRKADGTWESLVPLNSEGHPGL